MLAQQCAQVLRRHAIFDEGHSLLDPRFQCRHVRLEVHDRQLVWINADMPEQNGQSTPRHCPKTDHENSIRKSEHQLALPNLLTGTDQEKMSGTVSRQW